MAQHQHEQQLVLLGWISEFVITKENKGAMRSWSGYRWKYFIMDDSSKHDIKGKGLLPFHQAWNKSVPVMDERLKNMTAKVTELVTRGLRGEHIVEEYVRRGFFPLHHREPLAMFGDGPRNPRWLPPGGKNPFFSLQYHLLYFATIIILNAFTVENVPKEEVERCLWAILESTKQEKPEGFPLPYSAANPAEKDMFGPDPSEGGADNTMVLESSSSEKEPQETPKKSFAEAFADTGLGVDLQSLEEKVNDLRSTLASSVAPKTQAPKPPSPPKPAAPVSSSKPKPRAPPRTRSSKAKLSEEPPKIQLQPARKRKLKSPATSSGTRSTELPAVRDNPNPGDQVPLSIVFGTLFAGFSKISQLRNSQGKKATAAKRPCLRAPGGAGSTSAQTQALQATGGTSSSGPSVFGKIVQEVQAAEAWHLKTSIKLTCFSRRTRRYSKSFLSLSEKDTKINQLEADLASAKQALAKSQAAHALEVGNLRGTNSSLTSSVEDLKNKFKLLDEKLALKEQDLQNLQQEANKEEAVEEGYARCIAGSAYTLALLKHHLPHVNLDFVKTGFVCDSTQRDLLMDEVHAEADSFVTALQLIPSTTPAEEEAPAEDEAAAAEDDDIGDGQ
ncbi:hypothetical protein EJB05_06520, partial [Eragrostis curvula]